MGLRRKRKNAEDSTARVASSADLFRSPSYLLGRVGRSSPEHVGASREVGGSPDPDLTLHTLERLAVARHLLVNYEPNSTGGLAESPRSGSPYEPEISGKLTRATIARENNYAQAGERYRTMPDDEREDLVLNLIDQLAQCEPQVQERMVGLLALCDAEYGRRVAEGIGVAARAAERGSVATL